jgi:hypothetical protein
MASKKTFECTTDLMALLRFKKSMHAVASEVAYNGCISDVLGTVKSKIYEYEVKMSKEDLRRDLNKTLGIQKRYVPKKDRSKYKGYLKHEVYKDPKSRSFVPHYFYFVVPPELEEEALKICEDHKKYGVLVWKQGEKKIEKRFSSSKRASALNKATLNKRVVDKIIRRATSELVNLRMKLV